ncbi:hypothetical protein PoB_006673800 [Plakobranchus ocellatus]|uniref:Uncharacterized protein n=1 Tax=Plakobranchus ocellatus TaxID=259542 RepID=A0AAV4D7U8_9GAST|nr:hypothetical protein PoB_006673800 [Plakobranchus ocellatus]
MKQHTGLISATRICENENVDKLAKAALNRESCSGKLICWPDLKPKINAYIHTVWQENRDAEGANKLHEVLPNLGEDLSKRDEGTRTKRETSQAGRPGSTVCIGAKMIDFAVDSTSSQTWSLANLPEKYRSLSVASSSPATGALV